MSHPRSHPSPAVPKVLDADGIDPIGDEPDPDDDWDEDDDDIDEEFDEDEDSEADVDTSDIRDYDDGVSDLRCSLTIFKERRDNPR